MNGFYCRCLVTCAPFWTIRAHLAKTLPLSQSMYCTHCSRQSLSHLKLFVREWINGRKIANGNTIRPDKRSMLVRAGKVSFTLHPRTGINKPNGIIQQYMHLRSVIFAHGLVIFNANPIASPFVARTSDKAQCVQHNVLNYTYQTFQNWLVQQTSQRLA